MNSSHLLHSVTDSFRYRFTADETTKLVIKTTLTDKKESEKELVDKLVAKSWSLDAPSIIVTIICCRPLLSVPTCCAKSLSLIHVLLQKGNPSLCAQMSIARSTLNQLNLPILQSYGKYLIDRYSTLLQMVGDDSDVLEGNFSIVNYLHLLRSSPDFSSFDFITHIVYMIPKLIQLLKQCCSVGKECGNAHLPFTIEPFLNDVQKFPLVL
jgi:hypothetical protein